MHTSTLQLYDARGKTLVVRIGGDRDEEESSRRPILNSETPKHSNVPFLLNYGNFWPKFKMP